MRLREVLLSACLLGVPGCFQERHKYELKDAVGFLYQYESAPMEGAYMYAMEGTFVEDGLRIEYQWDQRRTAMSSRGWKWDEVRGRVKIEGDMVNYWREMLYRAHIRPGDDLEDPDVVQVGSLNIRFPKRQEISGAPYNVDEWSRASAELRSQVLEELTPVKTPTPGLVPLKAGLKTKETKARP